MYDLNLELHNSLFGLIYNKELVNLSDRLQKIEGSIIAIARKGPKLLELMVREGFLSSDFMNRVITDKALPFSNDNHNRFIIFDDGVINGFTLENVHKLSYEIKKRREIHDEIVVWPFAVSDNVSQCVRDIIDGYELNLTKNEINFFIYQQMIAHQLHGKPFDIEYPIVELSGNFANVDLVNQTLFNISKKLRSKLIKIFSSVPTSLGVSPIYKWTILLNNINLNNNFIAPDIYKFRIYLDPHLDKISIAAISPYPMNQSLMKSIVYQFPQKLLDAWNIVSESVKYESQSKKLYKSTWQSLTMWTNYLVSMISLQKLNGIFQEEFYFMGMKVKLLPLNYNNIQYLVGLNNTNKIWELLNSYLTEEKNDNSRYFSPFLYGDEKKGLSGNTTKKNFEALDDGCEYSKFFLEKLSSRFNKARGVKDYLSSIFLAQRDATKEFVKRNLGKPISDNFGIGFSEISCLIKDSFPTLDKNVLHEWFDRLIDEGFIVPKYMQITRSGKQPLWRRAFSVGEGAIEKTSHLVIMLFSILSEVLEKESIPVELFEKFCVLAIDNIYRDNYLATLKFDKIAKEFYLYGARIVIDLGQKREFLIDWACDHQNILVRDRDNLSLYPKIIEIYPENESPWFNDQYDNVTWEIKNLAKLVKLIHETPGLRDKALIFLSSVATENDLHNSLSAELNLWLHDLNFSIYNSIQSLGFISTTQTFTNSALLNSNSILEKTANYASQAKIKLKIFNRQEEIISKIDQTIQEQDDEHIERLWKKIKEYIDNRKLRELDNGKINRMSEAIQLAHQITSLLRNMLNIAGYKHPKRRPIQDEINKLIRTLDNPEKINPHTRQIFARGLKHPDIIQELFEAQNKIPKKTYPEEEDVDCELVFPLVFELLRPILFHMISCIEKIYLNNHPKKSEYRIEYLQPPLFIVMWDVDSSTKLENRTPLNNIIIDINKEIVENYGPRIYDFNATTTNDGNGFVCKDFMDVIGVYNLLSQNHWINPYEFNSVFNKKSSRKKINFRIGCSVNLSGELLYYPEVKTLGGRAYEYSARIRDFFKEYEKNRSCFIQDNITVENSGKITEPNTTYLIIGEFAFRYAEEQNQTKNFSALGQISKLSGKYLPRVNGAIPMSLHILDSNDIPTDMKQIELD